MKTHPYFKLLLSLFCVLVFPVTIAAYDKDPKPDPLPMFYHPVFSPVPVASNGTTRDFIPVSPVAASLGIFGKIPVGNFTGTAHISVPLYEVKYKELSVPISLSYHASGVKPDLFPGPVGLGWSIQAGGSITRIMNTEPDYDAYPPTGQIAWEVGNLTADDDWCQKINMYDGDPFISENNMHDPDEFVYNFNGITGSFYLNHQYNFTIKAQNGEQLTIIPDVRENITIPVAALDQTRKSYFGTIYKPEIFKKSYCMVLQL